MSAGLASPAADSRPQAPFGTRDLPLTRLAQLGPYSVLTVLDEPGPAPLAGQFYMLSAAERWGGGSEQRPYLPRAMSVARDGNGELDFMLEVVGPGTARLCELVVGDKLRLLGPFGNGFSAPSEGRRALLCGGGIGIAPLAILQQSLGDAVALLGFRDGLHAAGAALLDQPLIATDDGSVGHHGLVTDLLTDQLDQQSESEVYACGPPPMLEAIRALSAERGVPAQLAVETGMACGYGACYGCVVKQSDGSYLRSCVDGPVLTAAQLAPDWLGEDG